jgi:16S rRNA (guanine1516-N2)-methyltransferase
MRNIEFVQRYSDLRVIGDDPFPIRLADTIVQEAKPDYLQSLQSIADNWQLQAWPKSAGVPAQGLLLSLSENGLGLVDMNQPKVLPLMVDFASDALAYRKDKGGGKNEAIAKAVGIKGQSDWHVVDATAGLGTDSFILASVGCRVTMLERANVVCALLADGLARLSRRDDLSWLADALSLKAGSAHESLIKLAEDGEHVDVVYLDPMFPHKKKSAAVKKNMQFLQQLLGHDFDADDLLIPALALAQKRVVVKRPNYAPPLNNQAPTMVIKGKKHRFDVYLTNRISDD